MGRPVNPDAKLQIYLDRELKSDLADAATAMDTTIGRMVETLLRSIQFGKTGTSRFCIAYAGEKAREESKIEA